ncbi:protein of unknown function [Brochothrix thermosphacta]|uniref:Uncharacterized protein n=1 Tax=Brochothrix thermosphacta TaxID=2756 RepID=A0A2X0R365_BROTH|nr:protein of unknown function [Brochothrix thermosphacta]SPP28480.1 hypothetical protein BTBSAS_210010 [Brochothrix thermosphacta]
MIDKAIKAQSSTGLCFLLFYYINDYFFVYKGLVIDKKTSAVYDKNVIIYQGIEHKKESARHGTTNQSRIGNAKDTSTYRRNCRSIIYG